ncbi:MAG: rod shape-determining protein MreD [Kiloniellaceae bacterium]
MKPSVWTRLDIVARGLAPFAFTLLLVIAGMVPLRIPDLSPIIPSLALIAVYFWLVHQPDLMPLWAVFLIGLVQDLLGGGPIGVAALALLVVYAAVATQRRFFTNAPFLLVWSVFMPVAAVAHFLTWVFNCLIIDAFIDPEPAVFQYLTTVAVYPCLAWLFVQMQRTVLR